MASEEEEGKDARVCPIPRDVLLEMVREEARVRKSDEFQVKVAAEEAKGKADGTGTITQAQVPAQQVFVVVAVQGGRNTTQPILVSLGAHHQWRH